MLDLVCPPSEPLQYQPHLSGIPAEFDPEIGGFKRERNSVTPYSTAAVIYRNFSLEFFFEEKKMFVVN